MPSRLVKASIAPVTRYPGLTILVGDAAFSGRELNHAIIALGKDYVVQVKKNQPSLQKQIEKWFGKKNEQNPQAVEVKKSNKEERWELWTSRGLFVKLIGYIADFPKLRQIACLRKSIYEKGILQKTEERYFATSASSHKLPAKKFLKMIRDHWQVENSLHHVKDRSWYADKMYSKNSGFGCLLGILRNQALNILRTLLPEKTKLKSIPTFSSMLLSQPAITLMKMKDI